ncbi:hypothetical protein NDU88_007525 [Pleurodeles waltl]|uniref:Uncharacterized protein n=1 Tax=Pleurodeles waltl TaxID=8319 RepID=A0AAV7U3C1_PLEWA|nr:hypothetical protein NDU88_007525 [Pleurodeles waltl]
MVSCSLAGAVKLPVPGAIAAGAGNAAIPASCPDAIQWASRHLAAQDTLIVLCSLVGAVKPPRAIAARVANTAPPAARPEALQRASRHPAAQDALIVLCSLVGGKLASVVNTKLGIHTKPMEGLAETVNDPMESLGVVDSRAELLGYLTAHEFNSVMDVAPSDALLLPSFRAIDALR